MAAPICFQDLVARDSFLLGDNRTANDIISFEFARYQLRSNGSTRLTCVFILQYGEMVSI